MSNITKRLRSVIHSIAHHAISGLCYLHPHLGIKCKEVGIKSVRLNLLTGVYEPIFNDIPRELKLSTDTLLEKFVKLLLTEKIELDNLKEATAEFKFDKESWAEYCHVNVVTVAGKPLEVVVTSMGEVGEILGNYD